MPELWPHQEFCLSEVPRLIDSGEKRVCVTTPTGGGKTLCISGLIEWALKQGWYAVLYTNRKLLVDQLSGVLEKEGIRFGVRAAGYDDQRELKVQVSSLPTEGSRVLKRKKWEAHGSGTRTLAIVDEAHINRAKTARQMLAKHVDGGGAYVGFTATPIGLGSIYERLVIAGTVSELRKCGALVRAYHYGPDEPDMSRFKPNEKTGEYTEGDVVKAIMTKVIFGRVWKWYNVLNKQQRPTILFAPGVKESIWFAEQFSKQGVRSASIDGTGVWLDGEYQRNGNRQYVLDALAGGDVKVFCGRYVPREGLDVPEVSHVILATVMGSLGTFLQSVGRGLRACQSIKKEFLTIQDHGGNFWRHGSVNADRAWRLGDTEAMLQAERAERIRDKKDPEPIRCPKCNAIRASGPKCPQCGFETTLRSRIVIQTDGRLVEHEGDIYKPRKVLKKKNTESIWEKVYYRAFRSGRKNPNRAMTFRQAEALFFIENGYYPPRDLPLMPKEGKDWFRKVGELPKASLTSVPENAPAVVKEAKPVGKEVQGVFDFNLFG